MLRQIIGKEVVDLAQADFSAKLDMFAKCVIDIGTGDGKFVYEYAKSHPDTLVIGTDADKQQVEDLSRKVVRKPAKGGLPNVLFLWAPAEEMPDELNKTADEIYINFPWGSLLSGVALPNTDMLQQIIKLAKPNASLHIYLTYDRKFEATKIEELQLPELSETYLNTTLASTYKQLGIGLLEARILTPDEKSQLTSSWPKKILSQRDREIYYVRGEIGLNN